MELFSFSKSNDRDNLILEYLAKSNKTDGKIPTKVMAYPKDGRSPYPTTVYKNPFDVDICPDYKEYWGKLSPQLKQAIINTKTDTSWHTEDDTLAENIDENGNLSTERETLHKGILAYFLSGAVPSKGQAMFLVMGGGPASGKSSIQNTALFKDKYGNLPTFDSDVIKNYIPEYVQLTSTHNKQSCKAAANYVHNESSALVRRLSEIAMKNNISFCLDGTGDGGEDEMLEKINLAKKHNMKIEGCYATIDIETAYKRSVIRGNQEGRYVPEAVTLGIHKAVSDVLPKISKHFDNLCLYNTDVKRGENPVLIATANKSELKPVKGQEKAYQEFLDKANSPITVKQLQAIGKELIN